MSDILLKYQAVDISYAGQKVVENADFQINTGEILGIVGESGSGKSTLVKAALGILNNEGRVDRGKILFHGKDLTTMYGEPLRRIRGAEIGMVFQNPGASLSPIRKISEQFYETIREHRRLDKQSAKEEILLLFEKLQLWDGERILDSYPFELSGGMNQRVAIALTMMLQPSLILADEPTSALDVTVQSQVIKELMQIRDLFGTSILIVTHNIGVAAHMADQIVVMRQGRIVEKGRKEDIIFRPQERATRKLIDATPKIRRG